jgi:hypothetical protein
LNDVTKHFLNVFWGLKPEEQPLRPEALVHRTDSSFY